jgi:hypothetical protein
MVSFILFTDSSQEKDVSFKNLAIYVPAADCFAVALARRAHNHLPCFQD